MISLDVSPIAGVTLASGSASAPVTVNAIVTETDPVLTVVQATIHWGDGSTKTVTGTSPLHVAEVRSFNAGTYDIRVVARNFDTVPAVKSSYAQLVVRVAGVVATSTQGPVIFGPIPPRLNGFPGPADWKFDVATDLAVLEASVTAILLTRKGERVFEPDFGSNITRLIFDLNNDDLSSALRTEITDAVAKWEPRVELLDIKTQRGNKVLTVLAAFRSKLSPTTFLLQLPYTTP